MRSLIKCKFYVALAMLAMAALVSTPPLALASGSVTYTGQGFTYDGTTWIINDERCGLGNQTPANDGSTGQFADWNGLGQPYQSGQAYLVWVLTANGATSAMLSLPDGSHAMYKVGGTWKYASQYFSPTALIGIASATWTGGPSKANLTVSHGCAGLLTGAWCSPGFWKNTLKFSPNAWDTINVDSTTVTFNGNVSPNYYANDLSPDQLLTYVLDHPSAFGGTLGTAGPYGLTAYNAVGAYLTDQIPGYQFDPSLVGNEQACPLDAHGAFKEQQ